jgi:hypothetical protein
MSIFGKIKDAIFGHHAATAAQDPIPAGMAGGSPTATQTPAPAPAPAQSVPLDVDRVLGDIAKSKGNPDLNYQSSIVDLMKLLGLDSSLDHRKQLADELGYTGEKDGSAEMNTWLHKEVMRQLAANGGQVSAALAG